MIASTVSGVVVAVTAVLTWWACNAFVPILGATLGTEFIKQAGLPSYAIPVGAESFKAKASYFFNIGGLWGALAALPLAKLLGRRWMFVIYFLFSAAMLFATFGLNLSPGMRLGMLFLVGVGVYGVFGAFPFYLPELFPARLRATGAGFCYNIGRVFAAAGPLVVGMVTAAAGGSSAVIIRTLFWVGVIPLAAASVAKVVIVETRNRELAPGRLNA
jgi:MFS family permease